MNKQLETALRVVLSIKKNIGNNAYAIAYARTALEFFPEDASKKAMKVQVRYVLSNLQYWRGEEARATKKVLNDFVNDRLN